MVTTDSSYALAERRAEHNHPADSKNVEVVKSVYKMKERCKDTLAKPSQIYAEGVSELPRDVGGRMIKTKIEQTTKQRGETIDSPTLLARTIRLFGF